MTAFLRRLSLLFAAGSFGGLINSLVVWVAGEQGITLALGIKLAPEWTRAWLYPRLVWGGIWGVLFILPIFSSSLVKKGLLLSLGPTLVQLFVIFPYYAQKGMAGIALGQWTPAAVVVFNAVWGIATALWLRACGTK